MPATRTTAAEGRLPPARIIPRIPVPPGARLSPGVADVLRELARAHEYERRERARRVGVAYAYSGAQILLFFLAIGLVALAVLGLRLVLAETSGGPSLGGSAHPESFLVFFGSLALFVLCWAVPFYLLRRAFRRSFGPLFGRWTRLFGALWWQHLLLYAALSAVLLVFSVLNLRELSKALGGVFLSIWIAASFVLEGMHTRDPRHAAFGLTLLGIDALLVVAAVLTPLGALGGTPLAGASFALLGIGLIIAGTLRYRSIPPEAVA